MFFGGGVLLVGIALHIAWIGKRAEAKGRSVLGWVGFALALCVGGVELGLSLFHKAEALGSDALTFLYVTSPITLGLAPLILVAVVLMIVPARIAGGDTWPVFHARDGAGTLVILDDAVELRWADRTDRIARTTLHATADQESLRLAWSEHELLVMPAGKPANREGRMRQAEALAARLRR